jgi:flagellar hook-associated protein 1 FlgK
MTLRGTFSTLNIGRNSLLAHRTNLDVVGHNLANAGVEGYTRQRAHYTSMPVTRTARYTMGNGTTVDTIQRMTQPLVERRIDQDASDQSEAGARLTYLRQLEVVYTDESWGISEGMTQFFNSFRDLSRNPASMVQRAEVVTRGQDLARRFETAANRIESLQSELDAELEAHTAEANQYSEQVAQLNREIRNAESASGMANDLRDQRQAAVRRLAELVDVRTHSDSDGNVIVQMGSGHTLVSGRRAATLSTRPDANNNGMAAVVYTDADGAKSVNVTASIRGGELGGKINARDTISAVALDRLDALAFAVQDSVNNQHRQGFGLSVGGNPATDQNNFFTPLPNASGAAQALVVDAGIVSDNRLIAASGSAAGSPGDNSNALALADLENAAVINGAQPHDFWSDQVRRVGDQVARAERDVANYDARMEQSMQIREALSGVSVDEELAELVKVQTSFEASAKVITTADEVLQTILGMKR